LSKPSGFKRFAFEINPFRLTEFVQQYLNLTARMTGQNLLQLSERRSFLAVIGKDRKSVV
jgi:hypothetical protein